MPGSANTNECHRNLELIIAVCRWLGVPLKDQKKMEGPSTVITFLGIELDTELQEIRLPTEKIHKLVETLVIWNSKKSCPKRVMLSLRKLSHTYKVVIAGRLFLQRMIDTSKSVRQLSHWVHLNEDFHSDLEWWSAFLTFWNGHSMMSMHDTQISPDVTIFTMPWACGPVELHGEMNGFNASGMQPDYQSSY